MTYTTTKEIRIINVEEDWDFVFTTDKYGTVSVQLNEGLSSMSGETASIHIPKDCIKNFIDALEQLK